MEELRNDVMGFTERRIEGISSEVAKQHAETEMLLNYVGALMEEHGMREDFNRLYSGLTIWMQHFGRSCYMQGFRDRANIESIEDLEA